MPFFQLRTPPFEFFLDRTQFRPVPANIMCYVISPPIFIYQVFTMHPSNLQAIFLLGHRPCQFYNPDFVPNFKILDPHPPCALGRQTSFHARYGGLVHMLSAPRRKFLHRAVTCFMTSWEKIKILAQNVYIPSNTDWMRAALPAYDKFLVDHDLSLAVIFFH